ncbi:MAG: DGQHR domain-containing protein [Thermomicrobiales bacterium]
MPAEIPVVRGQPLWKKVPIVVGSIAVADLEDRYIIPRRDFHKKIGYQREPSPSRISELARQLERERVDLPTAVLGNIRHGDFDRDRTLVEREDGLHLILNGERIYIVDGQHRVEALMRLLRENPDAWATFRVPICIMLGATEMMEMEQFYVVNSTAKSVRTDLALDLLKHRTETDPALWHDLDERGQAWKVEAQSLAEMLGKTTVWKDRIRYPGLPKVDTVIGSAAIVSSLRPVLQMPYFQLLSSQRQIAVLDTYWQGIRQVLPDVFNDPERYALQKTTGVNVMHSLLVPVLEIASRRSSDTDPEGYADILQDALTELQGDTAQGDVVRGADFWLSGSEGAAGSFSSNAGRRVLLATLRRRLPRLDMG